MNNKRKIKKDLVFKGNEILNVGPKNQVLHPISAQWINTSELTNPVCLTKFQIVNNSVQISNNYACKTDVNNYKQYLYIPPIGLSSTDVLEIYKIYSIDELSRWIDEHLDLSNYIGLNRVLNCWIRVNYDTLKNYNNFLEKICSKIVIKYFGIELNNIKNLEKEIKDFIDYWINKNDGTEYKLMLVDDFIIYIRKKYNLK